MSSGPDKASIEFYLGGHVLKAHNLSFTIKLTHLSLSSLASSGHLMNYSSLHFNSGFILLFCTRGIAKLSWVDSSLLDVQWWTYPAAPPAEMTGKILTFSLWISNIITENRGVLPTGTGIAVWMSMSGTVCEYFWKTKSLVRGSRHSFDSYSSQMRVQLTLERVPALLCFWVHKRVQKEQHVRL